MSETTGDTFEIVTDDDTIWSVDHEGNEYSYQLTEAERLQDAAHNPGAGHDELPYGDKGDGDADNGVQTGALQRYGESGDGNMVMSETTGDTFEIVTDDGMVWTVDSDGNTYSYQLTEAERLQDAAHSPGAGHDELPYGDKGDGDADNGVQTGALQRYDGDDGDGEMVTVYDTDGTIRTVDHEGNEYSYQLTEAERLQDAAHNPGFISDDVPGGDLGAAIDMVMGANFIDLVF